MASCMQRLVSSSLYSPPSFWPSSRSALMINERSFCGVYLNPQGLFCSFWVSLLATLLFSRYSHFGHCCFDSCWPTGQWPSGPMDQLANWHVHRIRTWCPIVIYDTQALKCFIFSSFVSFFCSVHSPSFVFAIYLTTPHSLSPSLSHSFLSVLSSSDLPTCPHFVENISLSRELIATAPGCCLIS